MPTPHIAAEKGDFAKTVLMPGDPLRAKWLAETYLEAPRCVNTTRGMLAYTGRWQGCEVSVMGSGMGVPSIGIYSHELYSFYEVESILRIGSAGAYALSLSLGDVVAAQGISTTSNYAAQFALPGTLALLADAGLLLRAVEEAKNAGLHLRIGNVLTDDAFYEASGAAAKWRDMGVLCVEMESAGLYANAARLGKRALTLLTVSDRVFTGERLSAEQRERGFGDMALLALAVAAQEARA